MPIITNTTSITGDTIVQGLVTNYTPVSGTGISIPGINTATNTQVFSATLPLTTAFNKSLFGRILFSIPATIIVQLRPLILKVVQRTTTQLDSLPKTIDVAITETYPYTVDVSNYLASGDTISTVVAVLTFASTGAVVTSAWQGTVSTNANLIQVPIIGPALALGQEYQLAVTFTAASGKRLTETSTVNVVA